MAGTDSTQQAINKGPCVILVQPQMPENMGMTARAMMNCGLTDLRLVSPRKNHLTDKAIASSTHGADVLRSAQVFESVQDATADLNLALATTARPRDNTMDVYLPEEGAREAQEIIESGGKVGFLFGREKSGLTNEDLSYCDGIISIPLNPAYSSLNLAQSVLLTCYEWYRLTGGQVLPSVTDKVQRKANKAELNVFFDHFTHYLDASAFFVAPQKRDLLLEKLRNLFQRADLTENEVLMLHGVIKALAMKEIPEKRA